MPGRQRRNVPENRSFFGQFLADVPAICAFILKQDGAGDMKMSIVLDFAENGFWNEGCG